MYIQKQILNDWFSYIGVESGETHQHTRSLANLSSAPSRGQELNS